MTGATAEATAADIPVVRVLNQNENPSRLERFLRRVLSAGAIPEEMYLRRVAQSVGTAGNKIILAGYDPRFMEQPYAQQAFARAIERGAYVDAILPEIPTSLDGYVNNDHVHLCKFPVQMPCGFMVLNELDVFLWNYNIGSMYTPERDSVPWRQARYGDVMGLVVIRAIQKFQTLDEQLRAKFFPVS